MSLYPIYIDSAVSGATLSIGTTNTSSVIIGPVSQNGTANISTVVNGVRIDSHETNNNLFVSFGNNKYQVTSSDGLTNQCNTAVSNWAFGLNNMTGSACTAVGHNSLRRNTTGEYNTAIGSDTLRSVTTGGFNTALGGRALNLTTNSSNVGIGYNALAKLVTSGFPNVAVGTNALENYTGGGGNTAIGYNALAGLTTGLGNVAIGYIAENNPTIGIKTSGGDNVVIGTDAGSRNNNRCIVLGHGASASGDDQIILGKAGGAHTTYIQGSGGLNVTGTTNIGNSRITNSTNFGTIYVSTNWKNNVQTAPTSYQGDMIITTGDSYDTSITTGLTAYARPLIINGSDISYEPGGGSNPGSYPQNTGKAGDVIIRGGGASANSNNGTALQTLIGGNVYIDGGGGYCGGGSGNAVNVIQGSIIFRTGAQKSGNTYYGNGTQTPALLTVSATQITAAVAVSGFSDIRMKKNIEEIKIEDGLNFMKNKEVYFERIGETKKQSGYLAQDLIKNGFEHLIYSSDYEELEETVDSDGFISPKDKMYSLNYSGVTPYHGVVIKHLLKENDELKNEQKLQQDKITNLELKVELLQKQMVDILQRLN